MIEQNAFTIIFGIFMLFTARDVLYGPKGGESDLTHGRNPIIGDNFHAASIPSQHLGAPSATGIPTIRIEYCHSCGYKQAFEDVSKMLLQQYPDTLRVEGSLHQLSWLRSFIGSVLFFSKLAIIAMIYMDIDPFTYLHQETPRIWTYMQQNKVSTSLFILFLGNTLESSMMSSGAFEIYLNDIPIWSKIETGRMPSAPELLQAVERQMQLTFAFNKRRLGELVSN